MADSKALRFYKEAKAKGWEVEAIKKPGDVRQVIATRGQVAFMFQWRITPEGRYNFDTGSRIVTIDGQEHGELWTNVKAALREMSEPAKVITVRAAPSRIGAMAETTGRFSQMRPATLMVSLPFDFEDDDKTILARLAGHTISWVNQMSGLMEEGTLPRGGMHLKMDHTPDGKRVISFPCRFGGFRAVDIKQIVRVG